jgi:hypothetical protein
LDCGVGELTRQRSDCPRYGKCLPVAAATASVFYIISSAKINDPATSTFAPTGNI